MEEMVRICRDIAWGTLVDSSRALVRELLHDGMMLIVAYVLVAVGLATGLVLLLYGALQALRTIPLSDAVIFTIVGSFSLAFGIILLLWVRSKRAP
jgi:hypothetical protein